MQTINIGNPQAVINSMLIGAAYSKAISELCSLGVADVLEKHGPLTSEKICEFLAAPDTPAVSSVKGIPIPSELFRLLRAVSCAGVFDEVVGPNGDYLFRLNKVSELLCTNNPNSSRWLLANVIGRPCFEMFSSMSEVIRTGKGGATIMKGMSNCFEWFHSIPEEEYIFQQCLKNSLHAPLRAMRSQLDFSPFKKLVDVGGGQGHVLKVALEMNPQLKGALFDMPHISQQAKESNATDAILGDQERVEYVGGDFFVSVPKADSFIISRVLHDWTDSQCVDILKKMGESMEGEHARIFIMDNVMPFFGTKPSDHGLVNFWYDLTMMVVCGARERNATEFQQMIEQSGLSLVRIIPLQESNFSIIEVSKE